MSLAQYYTAATLDGFIADPDNSLDWLFTRNQDRDRHPVLGLHAPGADGRSGREDRVRERDVASVHEQMVAAAGERNVWIVGGTDLTGQFADAGLLDVLIVFIAPVTLGAGAPLLPRRLELRLEELHRNVDVAAVRYSVVRGVQDSDRGSPGDAVRP